MRIVRWQRPEVAAEAVLAAGAVLLVAAFNAPFWRALFSGRPLQGWPEWRLALATFALLSCAYFLLLGLIATRRTARPLLAALFLVAGVASFFSARYGVILDPPMLRNVLATDRREASELIGGGLLAAVAASGIAAALPWLVRVRQRPLPQAAARRALALLAAAVVGTGALLMAYQDLSSMMRNRRELRYLIAPANVLWSAARVLMADAAGAAAPREPPAPVTRLVRPDRPRLLVLVVGETVRAANFGLNGYARDTTPQLARLPVVYFANTAACGTSTEVSLPCMFSPFGRADYDAARIRRHESALHLLARAGVQVVWLDNQSGCKGVCDGLEVHDLSRAVDPALCDGERCLDEILLVGLRQSLARPPTDTVVVLHPLGNHGPAYFRRYPPAFRRFTPACERKELADCTREQIVNAYDNAILYTDHLLAQAIGMLDALRDRFEVAFAYVSDHGESLGEHGLYLHGLPYAIAPREQREVPMLWWLPPETARALQLDAACFAQRARQPASHDNLFHSLLGMFDVQTPRYDASRDLLARCRRAAAAPS